MSLIFLKKRKIVKNRQKRHIFMKVEQKYALSDTPSRALLYCTAMLVSVK